MTRAVHEAQQEIGQEKKTKEAYELGRQAMQSDEKAITAPPGFESSLPRSHAIMLAVLGLCTRLHDSMIRRVRGRCGQGTRSEAGAAKSAYTLKANGTTRAVIEDIRRAGVSTLADIAKALEVRGVRTPAGRVNWQPVQVSRLLAQV